MTNSWSNLAALYRFYESPLRPAAPDVAAMAQSLQSVLAQPAPLRVLILGVTPALHGLPWPSGSDLLAVDHTPEMIQLIWPGKPGQAVLGKWDALPTASASRDLVVGDGSLTLLPWPDMTQRVIREVHRVLVPGGLCALRLFTPGSGDETTEEILSDLFAGRVPNSSELKWRLWSVLQRSSREGVGVKDVRQAVLGPDPIPAPDPERLVARTGWSLMDATLFEISVRGEGRHWLATADEVKCLMLSAGFDFVSEIHSDAPWGEYCPTVTFRRKDGPFYNRCAG